MQFAGVHDVSGFGEILQRRAAETPGARAFSFVGASGEVASSYGELDRAARAVAAQLGEMARPGDRALILHPPGPRYVESFWGCLYAGVVAVPAYPPDLTWLGRSLPHLRALVADCGARVALTTPEVARALGPGPKGEPGAEGELGGLAWLADDAIAPGAAGAYRAPEVRASSLALLQYTSGSTGRPKGVMVTHANLLHNVELVRRGFETSPESVGVIWLPPYHDMGLIGGILQPAYAGFPVVLTTPLLFMRRPLRWLELVSERGGTVSGGPDFAFDLCVRKSTPEARAKLDLSRWRVAFCGAEPVRAATLERFCEAFAPAGFRREAFYPCYGLAEGTLIVSGGARAAAPVVRRFAREALREGRAEPSGAGGEGAALVGCGGALGEQRVVVVDAETSAPLPEGHEGEIWVSGPSVAAGYWGREGESRERFEARLAHGGEGRAFLRTGDLGFLQGGELFVTGRLDDRIIVRGRNHHPHDIERTVEAAHPALRPGGAAAFAVGGEAGDEGEGLGVACELVPGAAAQVSAALAAVVRRVAEGHGLAPRVVLLLKPGGLPRTSSGKVRRRACRQGAEDGTLEAVARHDERGGRDAAGRRGATASQSPAEPRGEEAREGPADATEALGWLRERLAAALGVSAAAIAADEPISSYGLDSLRMTELEGEIEAAFGVEVPATLLLRGASLREVAGLLGRGALGAGAATRARQAAAVERPAPRPDGAAPGDGGAAPGDGGIAEGAAPAGDGVIERPASEGQRALWFLQRFAPEGAAYHVARAFRVLSPLDAGALARALDALVDRHPSLRASFPERGGAPVERVAPRAGPTLQVVDARGWGEGELERRLHEDARRPFDLASGPLLRAVLFERDEGARLLFCLHHLVTDFWSLGLLSGELGVLYDAARGGDEPRLPPAGATPAALEAGRGAGEESEGSRRYWRGALAGAPPVLELPTDRPRPRVQSFRGASLRLAVGEGDAARVRALARECGATIFSTLLAAFAFFLYRQTGERDVVVGTPSAGRSGPGRARAAGYFVNPLALRLGVDPGQSFRELVRRARAATLGALEHQALPFSRVVEAVAPERDPGRTPIVQAMLVWQSPPPHRPGLGAFALGRGGARGRFGGLELESVALEPGGAPFDLTLVMADEGPELGGALDYCSDLFDEATAERMARHFVALLAAAAGSPDEPLGRVAPLDESERRALLAWAGGDVREPAEPVLHRLFERQAAATPEAPALALGGASLSYRELDARASRLARTLRGRGIRPEARVGVCLERGFDPFVAFWGVLKAGGVYVPLEPALPPARLAQLVDDAGLALIVTQRSLTTRLPALGPPLLCLDGGEGPAGEAGAGEGPIGAATAGEGRHGSPGAGEGRPDAAEAPEAALASHALPDALAYIIYTSGSTGRPKGVMVAHRSAARLAAAQGESLGVTPADRVLQHASPAFDASVWDVLLAHLAGACLVPTPPEAMLPGPELVRQVERERVSVATLVPSVLAALPEAALPGLRLVVAAGEALPMELAARWAPGRTLINAYGPTETTVCASLGRADEAEARAPSIGRPLPGARVYVLDEGLEPVPAGAPGELCVGGGGLARGYLGRPGLTAERFVPDPFGPPGGRLYRTGDRARWRPDGRLDYLGRVDRQIKVRGHRVEPAEIEACVREETGAPEAAVLAAGPPGAARLVAYVGGGARRSSREMRSLLRARLPESMLPSAFVWLDALPRLPSGKIDRGALPPPPGPEGGEAAFVAPRDELEGAIAAAWAEALGHAKVGARDHFFDELGGSSLSAVKVCASLGERLGREVPVTHVFEHPTVEGLAERLRRDGAGRAPAGEPEARAESRAEARRAALARRGRRGS
ncbi:MAG TPA: amino acid adenylation domain-containing protein [Polyangiaceae bacterium]|nr:amino acid adenylation domain-containing protein [Polyangiaceae bacterium]